MYVKRLLSQKLILANILVRTIDEFKGKQPEDAVSYIEGEPQAGVVPVEPGLTNAEKKDDAVQAQTGRMKSYQMHRGLDQGRNFREKFSLGCSVLQL